MNSISFVLNGRSVCVEAQKGELLVDLLRERLGLTGTKAACKEGECGACTVLLNGEPVNSCMLLATQAEGNEITTIEGLKSEDGSLHPVQQAFIDAGAIQCGFCTPGMVLSAKALLDRHPRPTRQQAKEALAGNLCRCTGYIKIIDAVIAASELMEEKEK